MVGSTVLIFIAIAVIALIVILVWYLRFRQNKGVSERVRRSPQTYIGRMARGVYTIPLPDNRTFVGYSSPPPTFSKAVNFPQPPPEGFRNIQIVVEEPPPSYAQAQILILTSPVQKQRVPLPDIHKCCSRTQI